jgi:hypothetical protein
MHFLVIGYLFNKYFTMKEFEHLYDKYLIKPANSVMHDPYRFYLKDSNWFEDVITNRKQVDVQDEFLELYPQWITSSKLNTVTGLETFPKRHVSLGTTQAMDDFVLYTLKTKRRLRVLKGEYGYAREISDCDNICNAVDDLPLERNDALLISAPFSATGDIHPRWNELINTCNELNIPVFVDCAFYGTCLDIHLDFNQPCIDTVAFSPTKSLNCGNMRTGMIFTKRTGRDCSLEILTEWHHGIHIHTYIAYNLMQNFGPDTIPNAYRDIQLKACEHYNLKPSKTIHLGLGGEEWIHYDREGICNRIGLRNAIYDYNKTGTFK